MRKDVLRFLLSQHPAISVNIAPFLKQEFPNVSLMAGREVLVEMINEGVIQEIGGITRLFLVSSPPETFSNLIEKDVLFTHITEPGIREIDKYDAQQRIEVLNQSIIDTNYSVRTMNEVVLPRNFRITKRLTYASIIVAGSSALFALAYVLLTYEGTSVQELQQTNSLLQRQVQVLDSMLHVQMKAPTDSVKKH